MKKAIFTALALALTLGVVQNSWAAGRTSASLATETDMVSDISQPRSGVSAGFIMAFPFNGSPSNAEDWLECNGQPIPANSDLYKRGVRYAPNLYAGNGKGYFLRAGSTPGQLVADTFRSHAHGQPAHTHEWEGKLSSIAVSSIGGSGGTIMDSGETFENFAREAAQEGGYEGWKNRFQTKLSSKPYFTIGRNYVAGKYPTAQWHPQTQTAYIPATGHMEYDSNDGTVLSSYVEDEPGYNLTGNLFLMSNSGGTIGNVSSNGKVSGTVALGGNDITHYTGNTETAPVHYTTRYFIKIND